MPRATPSYFQTHPLFYTLHLCSAGEEMSTGSVTWLLQNPSGSHSQCHTLHEVTFSTRGKKRKRKKKSTGLFFFTFQQRFFNWIHSALGQWLIYFLFQNVSFQGSVFISGEKTIRLLKENTSSNSGKVNALTGAGEGCRRLFQKLNYLRMLLDCVFCLELSYQHTVMSKLNNWLSVQCFEIRCGWVNGKHTVSVWRLPW